MLSCGEIECVPYCPSGAVVCFSTTGSLPAHSSTISNLHTRTTFKNLFCTAVNNIVWCSVAPKDVAHLQQLTTLLNSTWKIYDVEVTLSEFSGTHIMSAISPLQLERFQTFLVSQMGEGKLEFGDVLVSLRETITASSPVGLSKSPNKHNRLWMRVSPLEEEEICGLEAMWAALGPKILPSSAELQQFGWHTSETNSVYCVVQGNILLKSITEPVNFIEQITDSLCGAFSVIFFSLFLVTTAVGTKRRNFMWRACSWCQIRPCSSHIVCSVLCWGC